LPELARREAKYPHARHIRSHAGEDERAMSRLQSGGLIDRDKPLNFVFDRRRLRGYEGDTLASALVANGIRLVGRSFKYHRPRGILTAGSEEPNALVTLRTGARSEPNTRATSVQLFEGLVAESQNRWPTLDFDLMSLNNLLSSIFTAGFYYKTFMWPASFWEKVYEPLIRRAAGLGRASAQPDPDIYDKAHAFCDVLVVGSGPAGLSAALAASQANARVILVEDDWLLGGRLLCENREIDGAPASDWVRRVEGILTAMPNVSILTRTTVFGAYDGGTFGAVERIADHLAEPKPGVPRQRLWKICAKRTILATGAIEQPLLFGGNDLPGIMMASAVRAYAARFAALPGKEIVVYTTTDSGWAAAKDLTACGANVTAIIDARVSASGGAARFAASAGIRVFENAVVVDASGGRSLRSLKVRSADGKIFELTADVLAMSGGWNPVMGIGCNLGSRPVWSDAIHAFVLASPPAGMTLAGSAAGHFSLAEALDDGHRIGAAAAGDLGFLPSPASVPPCSEDSTGSMPLWHVEGAKQKVFVDFQHDVTDVDIGLAAQEGFRSVEHLKRYTTLGMATDQGRLGQVNGQALLARHLGKTLAETGTILSRPPFLPVAIGAFAGHHRETSFRPERRTASHDWAVENGAVFVDTGLWKRAQWFAVPSDQDWLDSVTREATAVRASVGVCDVSTLGKIDVHGPDAGIFLDRLYINMFSTLAVGKARYGVMLREDGFVLDDGTTTRLADDHYFMTTTTANAVKIMQHVDYCRQVLWPELNVQAVSVTEQWAQFAVAGPNSRQLLQKVFPDLDLSNGAFPYMSATAVIWMGVPARIFRLSFSGELAFEVAVPARYGDALVRILMREGRDLGVVAYGTEALGVLRIEKGHPAGNELSGQTTATDLGFGRMMSQKKDYVGRVLAGRPALTDPTRPSLVGLRPVGRSERLRAGAHVLPLSSENRADNDLGYVTSVAFSPMMGSWIGLGLVNGGQGRIGERLRAYDPVRNGDIEIEICSPVFVDPEGVRVRG
jgi:heterotetrameric sarcosine oxidase alpha subunit